MKENNGTGARIKTARVKLGFTLEGMSRETKVSLSYISDFERGKKLPSTKYLFKLQEKYGVSIDYIFTGEGEMFLKSRERNNALMDFGPYQRDIDELISTMSRMPTAMFAVLQFFSEYKIEKEALIAKSLNRTEGEEHNVEPD